MSNDIKCPHCGTLFGRETVEDDGWTLLTIKYRDMFRMTRDGIVYGPCRGCGSAVEWRSRRVNDR